MRRARIALLGDLGLIANGAMATPDFGNGDAASADCASITPGMDIRDALAIMGREPDSTLSAHTAAGPGGAPASSYSIDFWHAIDADVRRRTTSIRSSGGAVEVVDCDRPDPATAADTSGGR